VERNLGNVRLVVDLRSLIFLRKGLFSPKETLACDSQASFFGHFRTLGFELIIAEESRILCDLPERLAWEVLCQMEEQDIVVIAVISIPIAAIAL
jgi:hypothetical protein